MVSKSLPSAIHTNVANRVDQIDPQTLESHRQLGSLSPHNTPTNSELQRTRDTIPTTKVPRTSQVRQRTTDAQIPRPPNRPQDTQAGSGPNHHHVPRRRAHLEARRDSAARILYLSQRPVAPSRGAANFRLGLRNRGTRQAAALLGPVLEHRLYAGRGRRPDGGRPQPPPRPRQRQTQPPERHPAQRDDQVGPGAHQAGRLGARGLPHDRRLARALGVADLR
jgi:hypothetical protein